MHLSPIAIDVDVDFGFALDVLGATCGLHLVHFVNGVEEKLYEVLVVFGLREHEEVLGEDYVVATDLVHAMVKL